MTKFRDVASLLAQNAARAQRAIAEVEDQKESIDEVFEYIKEQLIARSNEAQLNISNVTADNCHKELSGDSHKPWEHVFDLALRMNETALLLTNRTLEQLEAQIKLWGPNLTKINSSVHDVTVAMGNAEHIRETAKTAAASAVSDVLRSLMREVCASAAELYEQHTKNNGFKGKTEAFKNNVSAESRRAGTEWKRDNDLSGMPQDVEDGFTYASKSVAVLKKHIRRADAQYVKVVSELEKEFTKSDESSANSYDGVFSFVRDINSDLTATSSPRVCKSDHIDEVVVSLLKNNDAMLKNVSVIVSLGELAAKVKERVAAVRDQMKKVFSSAAGAREAVEQAIR
ncbi:hypothetical protein, conserved in T.vivax [Trypanosoma vivax Y486]|uniref:Uncharacterized protein n=1 Tax=Trypanosoma vivax (strain Y486) TaxID=1055687 RepID=F9WUV9_TRYVY|nr:hypothetical protein, conserved in T.vivax [Trypanosoma vivax Y486]|eukprot:CCD21358.1 hypothetical protein, conserved in T.vivax [Trypanosoma vivax Y486]